MTVIRGVIGILLNVALAGLVAIVFVTAAVGPVATLLGNTPFVIGGGSMAPTIPRGSLVIVEPAKGQALQPGDIATFRTAQGVVVTHRQTRVVERPDGSWYETRGDANAQPDPALWPAAALVGRVVVTAPVLGFASWLLRQPAGWLNVLVIGGWLLLARYMIRSEAGLAPAPVPVPVPVAADVRHARRAGPKHTRLRDKARA